MNDVLNIVPVTDLALLGIRRIDLLQSEILRATDDHVVCRIKLERGWFILKWFKKENPIEPHIYGMLERYGVPTLPMYACSARAFLIEDLKHSKHWRMAKPADMSAKTTGSAVAGWYQALHQAGQQCIRNQATMPVTLRPWVEELGVESLTRAGVHLGLTNKETWPEAIHSIEPLKVKTRLCPQTFNYEDFAQENLALSRDPKKPREAIIFDYDCFTLGMAYSDWRNVNSSLEGDARDAFNNTYGPVSQTERLLDLPLSTLYGLLVASRRENIPDWARPLLESVNNGSLLRSVHAALQS
jgi:hypothetical protein